MQESAMPYIVILLLADSTNRCAPEDDRDRVLHIPVLSRPFQIYLYGLPYVEELLGIKSEPKMSL